MPDTSRPDGAVARRFFFLLLAFALLGEAPTTASPLAPGAVLGKYCITCHNAKLKTGGLTLDSLDASKVAAAAPVWEKVVRKLRTAAMPPAGAPRPDQDTYNALAGYLETELDRAAAARPNPGRPGVHRLNRAEYVNAIRDLLAIDTDAVDIRSLLPADDSGYGFDNIGDNLSVSALLMERYLSAARKISRMAVGDPELRPDSVSYDVSRFLSQRDTVSEDLPFGSRGGVAVRHYFPLDGEYLIKVRLKTSYDGAVVLGLAQQQQVDVRLDGARVKLFTIGGSGRREQTAFDLEGKAPQAPDAGLEVRIAVKTGTRIVGVTFPAHPSKPEDILQPRLAEEETDQPGAGSVIIEGPLDATNPTGPTGAPSPGDTASRSRIFLCRPAAGKDEKACAVSILRTLARRAYRRPITAADTVTLLVPFNSVAAERGFEAGIEAALQRMLVSPEFLFRVENDPSRAVPNTAYRIPDMELASRLSFFLWSSIPDDTLLSVAEQGRLKNPQELERQVRRMLIDPRAKALVDNFAGQWLYLRNISTVAPDVGEFPEFDENLREALRQETELFFQAMLLEDRPLRDLLDADFTFMNERLARHYGYPGVYGNRFRRVTVTDENRRGLLGQASILTVTSYANRTSPTIRGKWLLENILGAPPPPPPPNVPSLQDRGEDGKVLSVRQQLEKHRANPACASCHARMDPLGFALDNFDGIGKWRTVSGSERMPVDASGVLPEGTRFNGPAELRKILLTRSDQFITTVTEKLLTYALGRGLDYYDQPTMRRIIRESAAGDHRWSTLILAIARSAPFQTRRSREP
ncbi:MAG: DUF1592 domain-containing protein [Acidobacteria bacterium]|nr:DUF1592 domain-containing protein [Acidobacteriota bacterium]